MPNFNRKGHTNPAPFANAGWHDDNPYPGNQPQGVYFYAQESSYGPPRDPTAIQTRDSAAGMAHLLKAIAQTRQGRYGDMYTAYNSRIVTPTSFLYSSGAYPVQPSELLSGLQIPDWSKE